jgi:N,N'-diacetyllegionaminate synthase
MNKTIIIAEAGVNHNGSLDLAKKLVDAAVEAGADYVKFQTYITENLVNDSAHKADYQIKNTGKSESQFAMLKKLELSYETFDTLCLYCKERGINFLSTAFDFDSMAFLKGKIDIYKIPSGEITNLPYLRKVADLNLPIVMSTGMSTLEEVQTALDILMENGVKKQDIIVLHCNTEYPTPMEDVNLKAMITMREKLDVKVGYSDHSLGIEVPVAAVALGAKVVEKHFTLDKTMDGPDHRASLEPRELKDMVKAIRNIEKAMGSGEKVPSASEKKNIAIARKSIVAAKNIHKGERLTEDNLTVKRPGEGISPMRWDEIIGSIAKKDYLTDELI